MDDEAEPDEVDVELEFEDDNEPEPEPERPVRRRRGGLIGAGLLGVEQALYGPRRNEIVIVADADGMPEPDFDIQLTPDPRDSVVILRRHRWSRRH